MKKSAADYYPYGKVLREYNPQAEKYLTTHHERDKETGLDYRGARYYDSDVCRFLSLDPLAKQLNNWTPYNYVAGNPVLLVDRDGEWPGVAFLFFQAEIGGGVGYGGNYIEQSGVAYDDAGKTHFTLTSSIYIANQNLQEGSPNPQVVIGASAGASIGASYNWSANTFGEAIGISGAGYSVPGPTVHGKFGLGVEFSSQFASLSIGPQVGFKFTRLSTYITESVSLTSAQSALANSFEGTNGWTVDPTKLKEITEGSKVTGYETTVQTKDEKTGKYVDTGIKVTSGVNADGETNNIWSSPEYQENAKKLEK